MDLLFKEYASPFCLLDQVISSGQLVEFLDVFERQKNERMKWEFYIHKLPPWDERSWNEFSSDIDSGTATIEMERPTNEQLETTVKDSYEILNQFEIPHETG
jgi:hypothetical protein